MSHHLLKTQRNFRSTQTRNPVRLAEFLSGPRVWVGCLLSVGILSTVLSAQAPDHETHLKRARIISNKKILQPLQLRRVRDWQRFFLACQLHYALEFLKQSVRLKLRQMFIKLLPLLAFPFYQAHMILVPTHSGCPFLCPQKRKKTRATTNSSMSPCLQRCAPSAVARITHKYKLNISRRKDTSGVSLY